MKKKLIALDLDGTLLNDKEQITQETKTYLKTLKNEGFEVVIVTGRPYRGCVNYYNELNLTSPLICNNGNTVYKMSNTSFDDYVNYIPKKDADDIFRFIKDDLKMAFYNVNDNFYSYKTEGHNFPFFHIEPNTKIIAGDLDNKNFEAPILMMYFVGLEAKEKFEEFLKNYPHISLRNWGVWDGVILYELHSNLANKGSALKLVANYLDFSKDDIIAFGDGANDFELLNTAGHGVWMKNGNKDLGLKTKYHSKYTNNEDGVIKYLKEYLKK